MRKLMWFTIGFAGACALCAYLLPMKWLGIFISLAALCTGAAAYWGSKHRPFRWTALLFLGFLLGFGWYGFYYIWNLSVPMALDGRTISLDIHTRDYSYDSSYGTAVDGTTQLYGKTCQVRAYLKQEEPLEPGMELTGSFRLRMTVESDMTYQASKGIFLLAYQRGDLAIARAEKPTWQDKISVFRQSLRDRLHACFPEDTAAFAVALLLGDTGEIEYETDSDLKISGIRHVISVSGLHVSILVALLGAVTLRRKFLMVPVGLAVLFLFAALAGFTPSVVRSCVMSGLMLLAMLFDREYDAAAALSFAVLAMLIGNPFVITSVSLQMSAASVAGIFLFEKRICSWLMSLFALKTEKGPKARFAQTVSRSVAVTISAMSLTTPLSACYFGTVSLIGPLTNLLVLWVICGIFYGIMAACLLYGIWMPGAVALGSLVSWPIRYVLHIAEVLAEFPLAAVYTESIYIVFWLIFVYLLLGAYLLGRSRPAELICGMLLSLCISLLLSWAVTEDTRLTVLDVGQGQCILLESEGRTYMVDCGGDSDTKTADIAAAHLLSRGITHLDGLIVTHLDRDHAGGVKYFLSRVDTELLILPPVRSDLAKATKGKTVYASQNMSLSVGETTLSVFASTFPGTANEKSLCVLFDTEKCDILITGDRSAFAERMLLRDNPIEDVDILIAGHHGAKKSTGKELLEQVSPEIVCISVGEDNRYGHPAQETLQRLQDFGCTVYRTDQNGTIIIRR